MSINGLKPKIGAILTSDFSIFRLNFPFLPQCAAAAPELLFKDRDLSSFVKGWSHLHFPSVLSYA